MFVLAVIHAGALVADLFVALYADRPLINVHPSLLPNTASFWPAPYPSGEFSLRPATTAALGAIRPLCPPRPWTAGRSSSQVTMPVEPGDTTRAVGPNGCFRWNTALLAATMALLLTQTVECRDGTIFIDDHPLARPLRLGH